MYDHPPLVSLSRKKTGHIKTIILMGLQATQPFNVNDIGTLHHNEAWFQAHKKAHQKMIEYRFNG